MHADIPGVDPKDIEVHMENGVLSITGQRPPEAPASHAGHRRIECLRGSFRRRFSLPDIAAAADITATLQHGVLEVVIPKRHISQPRRIEVTG
jgi:HSP20 family protein